VCRVGTDKQKEKEMVSGVASRAFQAARILNVLSMVVLILGGLSSVFMAVGGALSGGFDTFVFAVMGALVVLVVTAVYWAMIQVASVVASYVGAKIDA
jgi:hypothetical protein